MKTKGMLFFDIDGTILNTKHEITERTINALVNAYNKGYRIALASGRCYDGLSDITSKLPIPISKITDNGAYNISEEDTMVSQSTFEQEIVPEIKKIVMSHKARIMYFTGRKWGLENRDELYEEEVRIVRTEGMVENLDSVAKRMSINKLLAFADPEESLTICNRLREAFPSLNITLSSPTFTEINTSDADKGKGIRDLAKYYGVDIRDTIAFGDWDNDIPSFKTAGRAVAMANSSQALLEHATDRTLSNDEDGVAVFIENNLL